MAFDFNVLKNINILKPKENNFGMEDGANVEDVANSKEPSLEDVFLGNTETEVEEAPVTESTINKLEPITELVAEEKVVEKEPIPEPIVEEKEVEQEPIPEPVVEKKVEPEPVPEPNVEENKEEPKEVAVASNEDFYEYMRSKLGVAENENMQLYRPSVLQGKPLNFKEIRDTKGKIKEKVVEIELKTRLSCIPFTLAGLNPNIVAIKDYAITKVGNEKYVSSDSRIVNQERVDKYADKWSDMISCAEEIREDLMIEETYNGQKIKTIAFNKAELDLLLSLFNQVGATLVIHGNKIEFVAGV